jgi:type IV pilus assembly protein PilM
MLRKAGQLVGVDIGSSAIKAVELKEAGGTRTVLAFATEPVPRGAIIDGTIEDAAAIAEAMRRLFDRHRIRTRDVAAAITGSGVFVKRITLPVMSEVELAASIGWEVEQHIPLELDEVHFDYQPVDAAAGAADTMEILLVAARKEKVAQYADVISKAGKRPAIVDVTAFALQNAYEANYEIDPNAIVALVDAGASTITAHILRGDRLLFTRDITASGDVTVDIAAIFDAFAQTVSFSPLDRIVMTGGASNRPALLDVLATRFGIPVERLDPFRRIAFDALRLDGQAAEVVATAAVAVGLALRRRNDR